MGDMTKEPSMEEILSSIKRIIAEEGEEAAAKVQAPRSRRTRAAAPVEETGIGSDEVLELTDELESGAPDSAATVQPAPLSGDEAPLVDDGMLSVESEIAARHSLSALSSMVVKPQDGSDNTLEGLVRAMLKPMLKEWLDANLPDLVQTMVSKEIARITGR